MKSTTATGALLALLLIVPGAASAQSDEPAEGATDEAETAAPAADVDADTVVARVGNVEITLGHVATVSQQLPPRFAQLPDEVLFPGIVDQLVDQYLLSTQVDISDGLPRNLELRLENERRALLANRVIEGIADEEVSEADLQAAYDETIGALPPETEYNASHILVETEEEATALIEELEGGADFAELAKEKSTGPSGPEGGNLGWFGAGMMVPEFEEAVMALEPGAVSEPVQTQFGWHVITLNETREVEKPALEDVRPQLVDQIRQERIAARVAELRDGAELEILTEGVPVGAFREEDLLAN